MSAVRLLPWSVHEAIDYVAGIFLIVAPFLFGFRDEVAFPLFVAVGVLVLANVLLTSGPLGVTRVVPVALHAGVDYVLAFFLIVAPFMFGFADSDAPLLVSMFLGLALLVLALVTAFPPRQAAGPASPSSTQPPVTES